MDTYDLGNLLKQLRGSKSLRQVEKQTDISKSHISRIENGERHPSADILMRLSKCYAVDYLYLYRAAGYMPDDDIDADKNTLSDIITLSRAQKKMTSEQLKTLRKIAETLFREAFEENNSEEK